MGGYTMEELDELRRRIDRIDNEIAALFQSRMEASKDIALLKRGTGLPVLSADRERQILDRVMGSLPVELREYTKQLFQTLLEISKQYQYLLINEGKPAENPRIKEPAQGLQCSPASAEVACPGSEAGFSHMAFNRLFPAGTTKLFVPDIESVFKAIGSGESNYGVVPVEASSPAKETDVLELIHSHRFFIVKSVLDNGSRYTRSIAVSRNPDFGKGHRKVSIRASIGQGSEGLDILLGKLSAMGLTLVRVESNAVSGFDSELRYHLEFEACNLDESMIDSLLEMERSSIGVTLLGCYEEIR